MARYRSSSSTDPIAQHIHAIILAGLAVALIVLNMFFPSLVSQVRVTFTDLFAPFMHAAAKPGEAIQGVSAALQDGSALRDENASLRKEITELHAWRDMALQHAEENKNLKALLKYKDDSVLNFLTTRVVADVGGNFSHSVIVTAGTRDGVQKNMVAMGEDGVVGRVVEAGEWSSRVLLYTDINFRLPVMLEGTQLHAILSGQGDAAPKLLFLPTEVEIKPGTRVVTSGHGGLFPPYLPVGTVRDVKGHDVFMMPYAKLEQLQMLRLVQYNLAGGDKNPINQELRQNTGDAKPDSASVAPAAPPPVSVAAPPTATPPALSTATPASSAKHKSP